MISGQNHSQLKDTSQLQSQISMKYMYNQIRSITIKPQQDSLTPVRKCPLIGRSTFLQPQGSCTWKYIEQAMMLMVVASNTDCQLKGQLYQTS